MDTAETTLSAREAAVPVTTVAELVADTLVRLGVGHCFGVVGSGNFAVTNALRARGVPFTAARHEGGAATMADAYARMSGDIALVSVHQGCGLTNAITGIGEAAKSRSGVIVLTAETAGASVLSNFTIDQPALARSVGAAAERVHSAASAVADVVRAYTAARAGRRTVVLNLPLDVQAAAAPAVPPAVGPVAARATRPAASEVAAVADLIAAARRPVIVAGRGARAAGPELRELGEAAGALLATSAVANGLFAGDPFALGISGGFSSPLAAELISDADLLIGVGCALNMWTMRHGSLVGTGARVVQIDDDPLALGAHRPVALGVLGDAALTARDLADALRARGGSAARYRTPEVAARISASARWNQTPTPDLSGDGRIDPRVLSARLDELLPIERIVSIDSGNFMGYPSQYLRVPDEFGFCFTQAFQSIGLGLPTAIGAALAQPGRLPVLGTGDGGFFMAIAELETAVRLALPLVVVVYNDAAYGAEVHHFADADPDVDVDTVVFPDTDIAAIARGYGATGLTVRAVADLDAVSVWLDSEPAAPLVIDAKIASDGGAWWLHEAFRGH
ncbi:thiamine pyrophosphate-binding protein [Microbacterium sp. SORGH_AS_0888]|uniref:thiamine pyrophosphate-binding protein n=1 Tax=Microbacterium sp. SORGH_AS_0888 TaxID=3041791 RepID=UPI00277F778C|nr:thiamine pyrophosphate-binding protein [Microbacterium sp. SORGH_AS_0888]MDQ1128727.1 acetolactate synthase-1/2/3 large subunit [Microbacterium sp. SORGH_AS_0888]